MTSHQLTWRALEPKNDLTCILDASLALPRRPQLLSQAPALTRALAKGLGVQFPGLVWVLLSDERGPAALLPLQRVQEKDGRLKLRCLQTASRFEMLYIDAQWRDDVSPTHILNALSKAKLFGEARWDVLRIRNARCGSCYSELARDSESGQWEEAPGASVLTVGMPHSEWLSVRGKNLRGQIRQSHNRLHELGDIQVRFTTSEELIKQRFERFVALEGTGYKAMLNPLSREPGEWALMNELVRNGCTPDEILVGELVVGGRLAASQLAIIRDRRIHLLRIAYGEEFAIASPGTFLMSELIKWCHESGRADFIDCVVTQPWHTRWHPNVDSSIHGTLPNTGTAKGVLLAVLRNIRAVIGRS